MCIFNEKALLQRLTEFYPVTVVENLPTDNFYIKLIVRHTFCAKSKARLSFLLHREVNDILLASSGAYSAILTDYVRIERLI